MFVYVLDANTLYLFQIFFFGYVEPLSIGQNYGKCVFGYIITVQKKTTTNNQFK